MNTRLDNLRIAVIGLGYVGLPLAVKFGQLWPVVGFDINLARLSELQNGKDSTLEVDVEDLASARFLEFTDDPVVLRECNFFIVTVPTPIYSNKQPNLTPLISASENVARVLKQGDTVVYESTVYPGATEEICLPILEEISGLTLNDEFFIGYSPERINPGDKQHRLTSIMKVTSGSCEEAAMFIDAVYKRIIDAGTHMAPSIKVAEAAKVIENTQRDLNIALVNELSLIFEKLGIDTLDVLEAAGTKWNFLPFRPGLVGGHCIGVDPYYLTYKAEQVGFLPQVILSGRRINDGMGAYIANQMILNLARSGVKLPESRILVMGLTFKENCPDIRNTRVIDIIAELNNFGIHVDVADPWANKQDALDELNIEVLSTCSKKYHGIIVAVGHKEFHDDPDWDVDNFLLDGGTVFDVKGIYHKSREFLRL